MNTVVATADEKTFISFVVAIESTKERRNTATYTAVRDHDRSFASLVAGNRHLEWTAGLQLRQAHHPLAGGVSGRGPGLAVELDCDLFSGIGRAPDGHLHAALQHHVVTEERGRLNLRGCRCAAAHRDAKRCKE